MPFSYATPGTGPSAGGIGWFNFQNLAMNPGDSITGFTGVLNDGSVVTFDMSLTLISGGGRTFVATQPPTFPGSSFGFDGYTGIVGNVAMYGSLQPIFGVSAFTISNIVVKDADGNPIPNYTVAIADAERTNIGEYWIWNTNGGVWQLLASLGTLQPPLTGLGTQIATITGVGTTTLGSYVLTTQAPTQLVLTTADNDPTSRQGFAIGFATTRVTLQKNIGDRIDPTDQFVLNIAGTPSNQATTTGAANGIQTEFARVYATPGSSYTLSEAMAPGSGSTLAQYTQILSGMNATPGGAAPPVSALPQNLTPALGDDVTYIVLNAAPQTFTKTVDKAFADIGEVLTYTVTVDNPNDFAVNNVLVTDATPVGTTYVGNLTVSAPYTGSDPATGVTITTIPANGSVTLSWQVQVNTVPPIPLPITNVANVSVPGGSSGSTNVVTTQVKTAYVGPSKTVDQQFAAPGDILTYTLSLNNMGNVSANNVVIIDAVPAGTTFVPGSVTGATGTPPTLTLTNPIAPGSIATVTFQVQIGDTLPNPNPIPNTASIGYTYTVDPADPNGASRGAQSNTVNTQVNEAVLTTTKAVDKAFSAAGDILTYTLTLTNTGNVPANNVTVTDAVPAGTTFVPGSVTGATGTPPTLNLNAPIPAGGTATVTFQVQVGDAVPTPNPIPNNYATAFTYTVNPQNPDGASGTSTSNTVNTKANIAALTATKAVDKAFAKPGDVLTYTLHLQNTGNTAANNVVLTDILPAGVTFINGSLFGATGAPPTLTLQSPVPAGGAADVTFQVLVGSTIPTPNPLLNTFNATFTYTADPANPNGATGSSGSNTVSTQVNGAIVTDVKTVDKAFANVGDVLTYTLTLQNSGNASASNVVVTDTIPAGTSYVAGSLMGATGTPPTLTLNGPIPAGGTATVTYQVKVGNSVPNPNPVRNTAVAAFSYTVDPAKPNGASGTAASNPVNTQINTAKLNVSKSTDKAIAYIGDTITYQIAVSNTGNVPADSVVITDPIPVGSVLVPGSTTVSVPYAPLPGGAIQLTNPVLPGETVTISFKVLVIAIPNPNPILNKAAVVYTYTVDPANPDGMTNTTTSNVVKTVVFRNNYGRQITDLITSVALEQAALAAIANAEGAKIQAAAAMSDITQQELLCLNKSVADMTDSITLLESVLRLKLNAVSCQIDGMSC